ncbi:hypothetical protein [Bifidobacterium saguini]|uniref:hypothetical protein n=1 Tax=Bifidobacterium saguini TaxID=762210 RepID=UPI0012E01736|nr:hypothetical protein [Bifidobacterium saguini]
MLAAQRGVVEPDRVHRVRIVPRVDPLQDALVDFAAHDFRVRVAGRGIPLQFDAALMVGQAVALRLSSLLIGRPPEPGGVETGPVAPCARIVERIVHVLAVDRVDARVLAAAVARMRADRIPAAVGR